LLAAALTEPLAAALHGVEMSAPKSGDIVCVLGPRRLGNLIVAALQGYRRREKISFEIVALARHKKQLEVARALGADKVINVSHGDGGEGVAVGAEFDIVFDTTASAEGFEEALRLSRGVVHLKSTHGKEVCGLKQLTAMVSRSLITLPLFLILRVSTHHILFFFFFFPLKVIVEIYLLPLSIAALDFRWPGDIDVSRHNVNVLVLPSVPTCLIEEELQKALSHQSSPPKFHRLSIQAAAALVFNGEFLATEPPKELQGSPFPQFDLAIISSLSELDGVIRPSPPGVHSMSLVRARGAVLVATVTATIGVVSADNGNQADRSVLYEAICRRGIRVHTSRCGVFSKALELLHDNPELSDRLQETLITHQYPLKELSEAFNVARSNKEAIKVVVETGLP